MLPHSKIPSLLGGCSCDGVALHSCRFITFAFVVDRIRASAVVDNPGYNPVTVRAGVCPEYGVVEAVVDRNRSIREVAVRTCEEEDSARIRGVGDRAGVAGAFPDASVGAFPHACACRACERTDLRPVAGA